MHKHLFLKYYSVIAVIITVTVVLLGIIASAIIGMKTFDSQSKNMERAANKLACSVAMLPKNYHIIAGNIFGSSISAVKETIRSDVIVINSSGEIETSTANAEKINVSPKTLSYAIDKVLSGEVYRKALPFINGGKSGYTVGVPVITGDNTISGAVFITTCELDINSIVIGTLFVFFICGVITLLIAFVILFFVTKKITKPIYEISDIANSYAQGDFSKRLDIDSGHEFAPLAAAFNAMADGIDGLDRMQSGFIADVSHELRTPITTIKGFVDGMLDGTIPQKEYKKYLAIVSEEADRVSRMVTSFLSLAKLRSGQISYVMKPFDIVATTGKAFFTFKDRIEQKKIELQVNFEKDSIMVSADEDAIYRVVFNLLDNAIKFTDNGGQINYSIKISEAKAQISIRNTGCGIAKEDAAHIFERFYKADKSRGINRDGTGIGLYLVKNIIKAHGEDIILTSKEGEFAQFVFTLPLYND